MTTKFIHKKMFACKSVFMSDSFKFHFVADASKNVNYVRIRVFVPGEVTRVFLRKLARHYINFHSCIPYSNCASVVTFYVALPSHRKDYIDLVNNIAKTRKKLLV